MLNKDLNYLRKLYSNLPSYNEETIKSSIVSDFFELLGYDRSWFHYEFPTYEGKKRVDISIYYDGDKDSKKMLFVEVKKGNANLDTCALNRDACVQLSNYIHEKGIEWGILTDGNCYILFNNNIVGSAEQKEVLRYYLFDPLNKGAKYRNKSNLKYFHYESIYKTYTTNYFRYLSEFKISIKNTKSIRQYESTIYSFLDYLSEKDGYFDLADIKPKRFKQFLLDDIKSKINNNSKKIPESEATIKNKFAYISSFCDMLENKKYITVNPFRELKKDKFSKKFIFEDINIESNDEPKELLKESEIFLILNSYNSSRDSIRNKIVFLLFLYLGLDIQEIKLLKVSDIDLNKQTIRISNRVIPLHPAICTLIKRYIEGKSSRELKCDYLISRYYGNHYYHFDDSNFNKIISVKFNTLDIPDKRKKLLNPSFIKHSLIKELFNSGFHIEEIAKFTGLSLTSLGKYITDEDISKKVKFNRIIKNHPYRDIFNKLDISK